MLAASGWLPTRYRIVEMPELDSPMHGLSQNHPYRSRHSAKRTHRKRMRRLPHWLTSGPSHIQNLDHSGSMSWDYLSPPIADRQPPPSKTGYLHLRHGQDGRTTEGRKLGSVSCPLHRNRGISRQLEYQQMDLWSALGYRPFESHSRRQDRHH